MITSWITAALAVAMGLWVLSVIFKIIVYIIDGVVWDDFCFGLVGLLLFCIATYYVHGHFIH
jgi:hypothetical protein